MENNHNGKLCTEISLKEIKSVLRDAEIQFDKIVEVSKNKEPFGFNYSLLNKFLTTLNEGKYYAKAVLINKFAQFYNTTYNKNITLESAERYLGFFQRIFYRNPIFNVELYFMRYVSGRNRYYPYSPTVIKTNEEILWKIKKHIWITDDAKPLDNFYTNSKISDEELDSFFITQSSREEKLTLIQEKNEQVMKLLKEIKVLLDELKRGN